MKRVSCGQTYRMLFLVSLFLPAVNADSVNFSINTEGSLSVQVFSDDNSVAFSNCGGGGCLV